MSLCCIRSFTCPCPVSPTRRQSLIVAHRSGLYCNIVPEILFVNIKSILFMIFSNPAFLSSVVRYSTAPLRSPIIGIHRRSLPQQRRWVFFYTCTIHSSLSAILFSLYTPSPAPSIHIYDGACWLWPFFQVFSMKNNWEKR